MASMPGAPCMLGGLRRVGQWPLGARPGTGGVEVVIDPGYPPPLEAQVSGSTRQATGRKLSLCLLGPTAGPEQRGFVGRPTTLRARSARPSPPPP